MIEIIKDKNLNKKIKKIHFVPFNHFKKKIQFESWYIILRYLYTQLTSKDLKIISEEILNEKIIDIKTLKAQRNSKIFNINLKKNRNYILKLYPDNHLDTRKRMLVEFNAFKFLRYNNVFSVPKPINFSEDYNIAIYEKINGSKIKK